jgi:hypothetical protein
MRKLANELITPRIRTPKQIVVQDNNFRVIFLDKRSVRPHFSEIFAYTKKLAMFIHMYLSSILRIYHKIIVLQTFRVKQLT